MLHAFFAFNRPHELIHLCFGPISSPPSSPTVGGIRRPAFGGADSPATAAAIPNLSARRRRFPGCSAKVTPRKAATPQRQRQFLVDRRDGCDCPAAQVRGGDSQAGRHVTSPTPWFSGTTPAQIGEVALCLVAGAQGNTHGTYCTTQVFVEMLIRRPN